MKRYIGQGIGDEVLSFYALSIPPFGDLRHVQLSRSSLNPLDFYGDLIAQA